MRVVDETIIGTDRQIKTGDLFQTTTGHEPGGFHILTEQIDDCIALISLATGNIHVSWTSEEDSFMDINVMVKRKTLIHYPAEDYEIAVRTKA